MCSKSTKVGQSGSEWFRVDQSGAEWFRVEGQSEELERFRARFSKARNKRLNLIYLRISLIIHFSNQFQFKFSHLLVQV